MNVPENLNFDEIVEIEHIGERQTYDFTIPDTHCFYANGVLCHNTLEEHCDSVILLYWVWRNDASCDDASLFEINVAKQRHGATDTVHLSFSPQYYRFEGRTQKTDERSYN